MAEREGDRSAEKMSIPHPCTRIPFRSISQCTSYKDAIASRKRAISEHDKHSISKATVAYDRVDAKPSLTADRARNVSFRSLRNEVRLSDCARQAWNSELVSILKKTRSGGELESLRIEPRRQRLKVCTKAMVVSNVCIACASAANVMHYDWKELKGWPPKHRLALQ